MNDLTKSDVTTYLDTTGKEIATNWKWRQTGGLKICPNSMPTGHIFNVVKMIWNNKMPRSHRDSYYNPYTFGNKYPDKYLKEAIQVLSKELMRRQPLELYQSEWLASKATLLGQSLEFKK